MNRELALLAVTVSELTDKYLALKFVSSIDLKDGRVVIKYSDGTIHKIDLLLSDIEPQIITKEPDIEIIEKSITGKLLQDLNQNKQAIIDEVLKLIPLPKNGENGKDGTSVNSREVVAELEKIIAEKISTEVERIKRLIPTAINGKNGEDGKDADEQKVISEVSKLLEQKLQKGLLEIKEAIPKQIVPRDGVDGQNGVDGKNADEESIKHSLMSVLEEKINGIKEELNKQLEQDIKNLKNSIPQVKDGVNGRDGRDADNEFILKKLEITLNDKIEIIKSELSNLIAEKSNSIKDGVNGKDADEQKILKRLSSEINAKLDAYQKELSGNLAGSIADAVEKIKADIPTPKNGVDGKDGKSIKGDKGDRGNGVKDAKIDSRDHLIITTDDKIIDAGEVSKKFFSSFGFSYTNELPMPFDVGGFKKGTRFKDVELKVLWTKLLYGYDLPYFSSFNINSLPTEVEVGYKILAGSYSVEFLIQNPELLKENSIAINLNDTAILSDLPNSSPVEIILSEDVRRDTLGSVNFEISAYDTTGTSFNKSLSVNYKYKIYYGEYAEDIEDTGFTNPMSVLRATELVYDIRGEYLFLGIGYKWFCYPEGLGEHYIFYEISSDIALVFDEVKKISITNEYGIVLTYNCYRTLQEISEQFVMGIK
ncbi:hypothetical protein Trichorick_01429 (plasmid) [Candidatus Trichorickettsia mobilis]|uniref:Uncharacterized protein n=1 Tax=Candidatus Trichorickettsia mobilis TaxID=1346319 RepID=A0ABZ0UV80_9RICK|nr:hypothetical protein [Candidatus Trichorickettsia mobilis]WPY01516.1 hypothetical protein Trichorick_01429 [Candidatus Trichorickettsia mobilis]